MPHIYARNDHDLMFAQGFAHALDRLWQMDLQRRLVAGRLSEVMGKQGKHVNVLQHLRSRRPGIPGTAPWR